MIQFFIPLKKIPTVTHQQKKVNFKNKTFYEPHELSKARELFMGHLFEFAPEYPFLGPVELTVKWCFYNESKKPSYKTTKPDIDNSQKLLQDCMTDLGFWKDDAQVSRLVAEKIWYEKQGIFIRVEEL